MSDVIHFKFVPTLSTSPAYTAGDVLFDTVALQSAIKIGTIKGITIVDKDDVGENLDLYLFKSSVSLGTANSAPNISDVNADEIIGVLSNISASKDIGGVRVASYEFNLSFDVVESGTLYVAGITTTAFTHTASGISLTFRIERSQI